MADQRYRSLLLFGAPGTGKGTQGNILGQIPRFFHLSSGEVFRALDKESPEGQEVSRYSSQGELVPDDLTIRICQNYLQSQPTSVFNHETDLLLLDGIPRNVHQAQTLQESLEVLQVVHLVASNQEEMVQRMKKRALLENRTDDAEEDVVRRRFEVYREESAPVLSHYPSSLISEIDALLSPVEVLHEILKVLIPIYIRNFDLD